MSSVETTKTQALRQLETATFVLSRAIESCGTVGDNADIPKAFPAVGKRLPLLAEILRSIQAHLKSTTAEADQTKDLYPDIKQLADECYQQIPHLQALFDTISTTEDSIKKIEQYRKAVQGGGGKRVEKVMIDLLDGVSLVAVEPLVSEEQIKMLQEALDEMKKLPPSLADEDPSGGTVLYNYGPGNQFYHGGKGHQNHCSGGFQVTGDNSGARYTYAEKPKEKDATS
ncbi:hypothetical protein QQX98_001479 [Neonectria punicea]|uniref:NACHT-NTPase and P-loop NTPases N-terminal domain-containing protein n=1 Tax=Neonectria punicea TaxID=979145 RepID=A0ABR1HP04_9HYPO